MSGAAITVKVNDAGVKELLVRIQKNLGDLTPIMKIIGSTIRTSIVRNFEKGGRPDKWKKHSKATEKRRGKGAKILMAQGLAGGLAASINYQAGKNSVTVGTNKIYGAVHEFGAKKGSFGAVTANIKEHLRKGVKVKAHTRKMKLPWGDIPARPFLMVQNKDWTEIRAALNDYILGGKV
ncbi:MAG: phage virion morphogenesis protein [Spirochaetales bacterium]|jgi:phage virion morphogenesis protein|nr:phage virion morphogenesis protein [Spirochaetales bacterium]